MTDGVRWREFHLAAADLATRARLLIERMGFVFLGTIRRDGSPRISPIEAHFVGDELMLVMIPDTLKARDVRRDPRVVLQSPVSDPANPGSELKLTGHAIAVMNRLQSAAAADEIEAASGWRPRPSWFFVTIAIERLAILDWDKGEMVLTRWDPERGTRGPDRRQLDFASGAYVRA